MFSFWYDFNMSINIRYQQGDSKSFILKYDPFPYVEAKHYFTGKLLNRQIKTRKENKISYGILNDEIALSTPPKHFHIYLFPQNVKPEIINPFYENPHWYICILAY
jgi:hypothetical protein